MTWRCVRRPFALALDLSPILTAVTQDMHAAQEILVVAQAARRHARDVRAAPTAAVLPSIPAASRGRMYPMPTADALPASATRHLRGAGTGHCCHGSSLRLSTSRWHVHSQASLYGLYCLHALPPSKPSIRTVRQWRLAHASLGPEATDDPANACAYTGQWRGKTDLTTKDVRN